MIAQAHLVDEMINTKFVCAFLLAITSRVVRAESFLIPLRQQSTKFEGETRINNDTES